MALTAANVITRAQDLLQDATGVRWPEAELLRYLNDGRREICVFRPDLYAISYVMSLVAGTKQAVPADGSRFMDALRNINADNSPGRAVRLVEREILDAQNPNWHSATAGATRHFMFDERAPKLFYVYPPAVNGQKLEISYAQQPADITNTATELTNEDVYVHGLVDYILYRAFSKDGEFAGNAERGALHYRQFVTLITTGSTVTSVVSPNTFNDGGKPPRTVR